MHFSSRERMLLRLPAFAVLFYVLFSGIGLRLLNRSNVFPFSLWDMFTVQAAKSIYYQVDVVGEDGRFICVLPGSCSHLYRRPGREQKMAYLIAAMGRNLASGDQKQLEAIKEQFLGELLPVKGSRFALRSTTLDFADMPLAASREGGQALLEFGGDGE